MASELDMLCAIVAVVVGIVLGSYIALFEYKERKAILEKAKGNRYIGTEKSKIFHYYTCQHVKRKYRAGKRVRNYIFNFRGSRRNGI